jgi:uncharacterized protein (DUF302 family)
MLPPSVSNHGLIVLSSSHSVSATIDRLESLLKERGVLIFARIDFSADAARAGLQMRPEQLLIFGNPKAGTALMVAEPAAGIDLPLKALAWEASDGQVRLAYNDPAYIIERHGLAGALAVNLAAVVPIIEHAAQA